MNQKFTKQEDGKVLWTFESEETEMTHDNVEGVLGTKKFSNEIIFNNKKVAMEVLESDIENTQKNIDYYEKEMNDNAHDIDKFKELQNLLMKITELNNEISNIKDTPKELYAEHPKKYQKLWSAFGSARQVISQEVASIANDYQAMQKYNAAKKSCDFNKEQLDKIKEQKKLLSEL